MATIQQLSSRRQGEDVGIGMYVDCPTDNFQRWTGISILTSNSKLYSSGVNIAVGVERQLFMVHKALLEDIPYFRSQFRSTNLGAIEPVMNAEMCHTRVFGCFIPFLYQHPLKASQIVPDDVLFLIPLHEMCEKWGAVKYADSVMAVIVKWVELKRDREQGFLNKPLVQETYNRMPKGSKLRKFLVWYALHNGMSVNMDLKWLDKVETYDRRFAIDIAFHSTRLHDKHATTREVAISGLRDALYFIENGHPAAI
ncbi:hypothetical protein MMC26_003991 [Xylographa opegraphella]|nr:hypothetical protein [Xylographa opegraphella]